MVFFIVDALVFLPLVVAVDEWVGDTDEHIQYTPSEQWPKDACTNVTDPDCEGLWWGVPDNTTYRSAYARTWGNSTRMKLPFQGSGITVKGICDVDGARAFATVDDVHEAALDFTSSSGRQLNQTVYAVDGLATDVSHVLAIWYNDTSYGDASAGRRYVNLDAFIVSFPDTLSGPFLDVPHPLATGTTSSVPVPTSGPSSTLTTSAAPSQSSSHGSSTIAIAIAVPLSALALGMTIIGWLILRAHYRRLRQRQNPGRAEHNATLQPYWGHPAAGLGIDMPIAQPPSKGKTRTGPSSSPGMSSTLDDRSLSLPTPSHRPLSIAPPPTYYSTEEA